MGHGLTAQAGYCNKTVRLVVERAVPKSTAMERRLEKSIPGEMR
jgi:hypothetical protein